MVASRETMGGDSGDLLPRAELRGLVSHLRKRALILSGALLIGFLAGFPAAGEAIELLLGSSSYRPDGVEIVILHPMEAILLKLRIGINFGILLSALVLMCDLTWNGRRIVAESRRSGDYGKGNFGGTLVVVFLAFLLGLMGAAYSHGVLVPLLLDYLSNDAASAGLATTWQLQSWVGFITGLYFASILGFQVPLIASILLRSELIERSSISDNRGNLWFAGLILGALISPPDPVSMFLVAGPMLLLLEVALVVDRITRSR
ncbi:MAG: hypothetical protein CMA43_00340 [Euryarchaeota archaeon]|nr:hypothetical protein [Euryarchaeota archaeon]|tara:strand:- start:50 stop:832 length:783 start_codon:yes stop_codon:yes gene_type:complete